jgi:hypothetical protein
MSDTDMTPWNKATCYEVHDRPIGAGAVPHEGKAPHTLLSRVGPAHEDLASKHPPWLAPDGQFRDLFPRRHRWLRGTYPICRGPGPR